MKEKSSIIKLTGDHIFSFLSMVKYRVSGGILLMGAAVLALVIANSPWSGQYFDLWNMPIHLQIGDFNFFNHHGTALTLKEFINDALIAVFFFMIGLELKREILVGELSSFRQAILPIITGIGGVIVPILIYLYITKDPPYSKGFGIPMATDIAFALGVLNLFGSRVPLGLKVFMTAFAVIDDIMGIIIIAIFYSGHIDLWYFLYAVIILIVLIIGNQMNVRNNMFYILLGAIVWYFILQSGIHSTLAGVLVAFTVPATPSIHIGKYINYMKEKINSFPQNNPEDILLTKDQIGTLKNIESNSDKVISPLQSIEDSLHGMVNYLIMPLFALTNAGVVLIGNEGELFTSVTLAVFLGLFIGKFIGLFTFSFLSIKLKLAPMPNGINIRQITGSCMLGGIGFTLSLFIASLAYGDAEYAELLNQAKLGVILSTLTAGIVGCLILHKALPKKIKAKKEEEIEF